MAGPGVSRLGVVSLCRSTSEVDALSFGKRYRSAGGDG
ncbi:hypothetical protein RISK_003016 [Rhodopirellula islandica]|uniref:Uncharacterized protein n=1 Tax=Rhodopirellula islandica TaxID=595434 RepID=A0A0J1BDQ4_RHOIS|nr:hypothetical protein RISK_003016 [Rhodopirellula islandica]